MLCKTEDFDLRTVTTKGGALKTEEDLKMQGLLPK